MSFSGLLPEVSEVWPLQEHASQSYCSPGDKEKVMLLFFSSLSLLKIQSKIRHPSSLCLFPLSVFPFMRRQRHASPSPAQASAQVTEEDGQAKGAGQGGSNSAARSNVWCQGHTHLHRSAHGAPLLNKLFSLPLLMYPELVFQDVNAHLSGTMSHPRSPAASSRENKRAFSATVTAFCRCSRPVFTAHLRPKSLSSCSPPTDTLTDRCRQNCCW